MTLGVSEDAIRMHLEPDGRVSMIAPVMGPIWGPDKEAQQQAVFEEARRHEPRLTGRGSPLDDLMKVFEAAEEPDSRGP